MILKFLISSLILESLYALKTCSINGDTTIFVLFSDSLAADKKLCG